MLNLWVEKWLMGKGYLREGRFKGKVGVNLQISPYLTHLQMSGCSHLHAVSVWFLSAWNINVIACPVHRDVRPCGLFI